VSQYVAVSRTRERSTIEVGHVGDLDLVRGLERAFSLDRLGGAGHVSPIPIERPYNHARPPSGMR
jgi:hypothetical protein